jgi:NAD(P)-dependent dehydrogenase (short-subunit alcohol dehydrogenase family)
VTSTVSFHHWSDQRAGLADLQAGGGGDDQDWANGMAVRVLGARVLGARVAANAVLPQLRDGRGSLLFTGGGLALHPTREYAFLSVGKAALRAYVHVLHDQLAGIGVHATTVTITKGIGSDARLDGAALAQDRLPAEPAALLGQPPVSGSI